MTLIVYHFHEHKLQADSRLTQRLSTDARQCNTPAALSRAYHEEPGHMFFLDQQSMQRHSLHTIPRFLKDLPQSEKKLSPWCCDLDKNHIGHLLTLIPLFLGIFYKST